MKFSARPVLLALGVAVCTTSVMPVKGGAQAVGQCTKVTETKIIRSLPAVVPQAGSCATSVSLPVAKAAVVPFEARTDEDIIYTPIANDLKTRIPVCPAFFPTIDTIKLQIANRMNSGLVSGQLVSEEADEVQAALDQVSLQEANLKLTYGGVNDLMVANLMPKYHMVNQLLDSLLNNSVAARYMPSFGVRRAAMRDHILYHQAAANITPSESEQLLAALHGINDQYVSRLATGGTVSADELEQSHADLFNINRKLASRISAPMATVVPEVIVQESDLLKTIQNGIACRAVTPEEGNRLTQEYNRLVVLRQTLAADAGYHSREIAQLTQEIDNLKYVLDRQIHDRQVAGAPMHY
jgi:hypothetical protein